MFGFITAGISAISNAAKNLFSGEAKAARVQARTVKKEAKAAAKEAKETAKKAITGGGIAGAKAGQMFASIKTWFVNNWQIVAIVIAALGAIYMLFKFFGKKKGAPRRRSSGRAGSSSMKARMAKVRAARRRKRK